MNSNFIKFSKSLTELGDGFVIGSSILINEKYINTSIKDLGLTQIGITLILIKRNNETFLPTGNVKLNLGDVLTVVGKVKDVTNFFGLINLETNASGEKKAKIRRYEVTKLNTF